MTARDPRVPWPTEDGRAPEALSAMLEVAREEHGNAEEVARLSGKMAWLLLPASTLGGTAQAGEHSVRAIAQASSASGGAAGSLGVGATLKGLTLAALLTAGGATTYWAATSERAAPEVAAVPVAPRNTVPSEAPPAAAPAMPAAEPERVASPEQAAHAQRAKIRPASKTAPATRRTRRPRPPATSITSSLNAEAELLQRAKGALNGQPALALQACQTHARRFPEGLLAEERENLAIQSLLALGHRDRARARLQRFTRHYPGSVHVAGLEALLER